MSAPMLDTAPAEKPNRQRRTVILLTLMVLVAGCAPTIRYVYNKPGVTQEQRARDERECERLAMVLEPGPYGYGGSYTRFDRGRLNRCMEGRGYEVRELRE